MSKTQNGIGRWAFATSAIFFGLYFANVLIGKASTLLGAGEPMSAGDVPEFLALFAASICFVIGTLEKEKLEKEKDAEG
jgi:hypothetical protein